MSSMNITDNYNGSSVFQLSGGFTKTYTDTTEEVNEGIDFATAAKEAISNYVTNANFSAGATFGDISNNISSGVDASQITNSNKNTNDSDMSFEEASGMVSASTNQATTTGKVANSAMQASTQSASLNTQMQMLASMRSF